MVKKQKIGIIHPGQMGISVAASAKNSGHDVYWASEGRSSQTRERAAKFGLADASTLAALCETCTVIVSVCPPHAAEETSEKILAYSFQGLYLDVNAIAPERVIRMGRTLTKAGMEFVDGGIIGLPAWKPGKTWLYLSGKQAEEAASCFSAGPLETCIIGEAVGKASALKMCYAAFTKGTTALLAAILATAEVKGVRKELESQWSREDSGFAERTKEAVRGVTAKAWRFTGEMDEIAATFREAGLPGEFHGAAGAIYRRLAGFKHTPSIPSLEEVLFALTRPSKDG